eukprot:TRINITY_DN2495_c1_g1_i1.p2 TRINITY_DN2495_c1_g1~~TRINITY_DN2495_c1_g1_i1.p2  ORF type:complete len:280 (-),score=43.44 TRINITY_DN2495_c1_g1_i1:640-1479(-)
MLSSFRMQPQLLPNKQCNLQKIMIPKASLQTRSRTTIKTCMDGSKEFLSALQTDLDYEVQNPITQNPFKNVPKPFKLKTQKGSQTVELVFINKNEIVKVTSSITNRKPSYEFAMGDYDQDDDDEDFDDEQEFEDDFEDDYNDGRAKGYQEDDEEDDDEDFDEDDDESEFANEFTVQIQRQNQENNVIEFQCIMSGGRYRIRKILYRLLGKAAKEIVDPYLGPDEDSMDEYVEQGARKYLEERYINPEFLTYLNSLLEWKQQEEYKNWLHNTIQFLEPTS